MPKLTDPWFEAHFYGEITETSYHFLDSIEGAQGLWLWCPCGFGRLEFPLEGPRPHGVCVPFQNPRNALPCPPNHGPFSKKTGSHPRWTMSGSSLEDLTLSPSIDVGGGRGDTSCWHGFITGGEVR